MRRKELSYRTKLGIGALILTGSINIVILCVLISWKMVPVFPLCWLIAGEFFVYALLVYLLLNGLYKPYKEMEKLYQCFANGQAYEELFQAEYEWMPGWDEVMERIRYLINKQDAIRMSKKQAEYLALQNQINPHFLYNTLEAIRGDAVCAGVDSIAETTEALSVFFRYSVTGVDALVTLEEELDNVKNYFTIQYYRFGDRTRLQISYPEEDKILQLKIPKLTIQPFVENAIHHGLEKKMEGGIVKIKLDTTENKLIVTIYDNGVGMPEEQVERINAYFERVAVSYVGEDRKKRGGIAMKNVNSRIKLLFGEQYGVHVYSVEKIGTDIIVTLPKLEKRQV